MLEVIKKLDAGVVRGLLVAFVPLLVLIGSLFGLDESVFKASLDGWVEKVVAIVAAFGVAWAAWERLTKATPPLTEAAAKATDERLKAEGKTVTDSAGTVVAGVGVSTDTAVTTVMTKQKGNARIAMLAVLSVSALVGCAFLGQPSPKTFNDRVAAAYSTVTAVREAAIVQLDAQVARANRETDATKRTALLTAARADAQNIQDQADKVREGLDIAKSMGSVDLKSAENRLASSLTILQALQTYMSKE